MLLGLPDRGQEICRCLPELLQEVHLFLAFGRLIWPGTDRPRQLLLNSCHPRLAFRINLCGVLILHIGQIDQTGIILQGIKDHEDPADHEFAEQFLFVQIQSPDPVKGRHDLIVQIAHHTAIGQWQVLILERRMEAVHILLDARHRISRDAFHSVIFLDHELILIDLQPRKRLSPDKGISPKLLMCRINRLQDEPLLFIDQLVVHRNRCVHIHVQLRRNGDEICCFR